MLKIQFALIFSLIGLSITGIAATSTKKTVCSITINSDNEINTFKKFLDPQVWNFVELTDNVTEGNKDNFLQRQCRPDLKCDVLVISGHFSGSFTGSSRLNLPVSTLEKLSCQQECEGLFKNLSEVYLFGCNTLSARDSVEQNPGQLLAQLESNGYSRTLAAQVMAFRATRFGLDMKDQMKAIFPWTPSIIGFSKVAPTGPQIEPALVEYLKNQNNRNFEGTLKTRGAIQVSGLEMSGPLRRPYCAFNNPKIEIDKKFALIKDLFENNLAIQNLKHIKEVIFSLKNDLTISEANKASLLESIKTLPKIKKTFSDAISLKGDAFISFKAEILQIIYEVGLIEQNEFEMHLTKILDLNTPFNKIKTDLICAANVQINISLEDIPPNRWTDENFINALGCFKPKDSRIFTHLLNIAKNLDRSSFLRTSIFAIMTGRKNHELEIQKNLIESFLTEENTNNRQLLAFALRMSYPIDSSLRPSLIRAEIVERNEIIKRQLAMAIGLL